MMEWLKILVLMFVCVSSDSTTITIQRESSLPIVKNFEVYWNVPSEICKQFNIDFKEKLKHFEITVNTEDKFRGDKIVILYDPGLFPAMVENTEGNIIERNGGIPQKGNIDDHLEAFKKVIEQMIDPDFAGLGVIDFEIWRPVFRQNWNDQTVYKDMSINLAKQNNSKLSEKELNDTAAQEFEKAAKKFMEQTIKTAKMERPDAKWGFYGFPYCYNYRVERTPYCPDLVPGENDQIKWLFKESGALYPSIYMSSNLTTEEQKGYVIGKLNEAWRITKSVSDGSGNYPPVFPYFWFKYYDEDKFVSKADIYEALENTRQYQMGGVVIWGASGNVNTEKKCKELMEHLENDLGPTVLEVRKKNKQNLAQSS